MKITFEVDGIVATVEDKDLITLPEALTLFEQVLRGAGFHFNGSIDIDDTDIGE
jgi:hypothetical protein